MTVTPELKRFDTERELTDYADMLNEAGGDLGQPEIPVMDSQGNSFLATLQAPGGDGWGFAYYGVNEPEDGRIQGESEGGWVQPSRHVDSHYQCHGDELTWPVYGLIVSQK